MKDSRKHALFTASKKYLRNYSILLLWCERWNNEISQVGTQMVEKLANKTLRVVTTTVLFLFTTRVWIIMIIHFYQFPVIWTIIINLNTLGDILFIFQNSPYVMEKEFGPEVTHNKYETFFQCWRLIGEWGWCWWQGSQLLKYMQNLFFAIENVACKVREFRQFFRRKLNGDDWLYKCFQRKSVNNYCCILHHAFC